MNMYSHSNGNIAASTCQYVWMILNVFLFFVHSLNCCDCWQQEKKTNIRVGVFVRACMCVSYLKFFIYTFDWFHENVWLNVNRNKVNVKLFIFRPKMRCSIWTFNCWHSIEYSEFLFAVCNQVHLYFVFHSKFRVNTPQQIHHKVNITRTLYISETPFFL